MIVVDTNIIAYLLLPTSYTGPVEALFKYDADWGCPGTLEKRIQKRFGALFAQKNDQL